MDHLNRLDEPVFIAVQKPLLLEFGTHHGLTSYIAFALQQRLKMKTNLESMDNKDNFGEVRPLREFVQTLECYLTGL